MSAQFPNNKLNVPFMQKEKAYSFPPLLSQSSNQSKSSDYSILDIWNKSDSNSALSFNPSDELMKKQEKKEQKRQISFPGFSSSAKLPSFKDIWNNKTNFSFNFDAQQDSSTIHTNKRHSLSSIETIKSPEPKVIKRPSLKIDINTTTLSNAPLVTSPTTVPSLSSNTARTIFLPPIKQESFSISTNKMKTYVLPHKRIQSIKDKISSIETEHSANPARKITECLDLAKDSSLSPAERLLYTEVAAKTAKTSEKCIALRTEACVTHARALISNNKSQEAISFFINALKYLGSSNNAFFITKEQLQKEIKSIRSQTT